MVNKAGEEILRAGGTIPRSRLKSCTGPKQTNHNHCGVLLQWQWSGWCSCLNETAIEALGLQPRTSAAAVEQLCQGPPPRPPHTPASHVSTNAPRCTPQVPHIGEAGDKTATPPIKPWNSGADSTSSEGQRWCTERRRFLRLKALNGKENHLQGEPAGRRRGLEEERRSSANHKATHLKGRLSCQALVNDGANTPQVGLGIVVLGHDDFWGLPGRKNVDIFISCLR